MKGFGVFVAVSLALHALAVWQMPEGGVDAQGAGGADTLTLTPASEATATMVQRWDRPPEVAVQPTVQAPSLSDAPQRPLPDILVQQSEATALSTPSPDARPMSQETAPALRNPDPDISALSGLQLPALPGGFSAPQAPTDARPTAVIPTLTTPEPIAAPTLDMRPHYEGSTDLATQASPRPRTRPEGLAPPPPPSPASPQPQAPRPQSPAPDRTAAGSGGGSTQGTAPQPTPDPVPPPSASAAQVQSAMAQWGGQIQARIARSRPRVAGTGRAVVQLRVGTNGRLQGVGLARSSGNAAVDQAAISAVQRAGRFPRAPRVLTDAAYSFSLPVSFQ